MKKLFLSLVAAIVAATATYAQSDLVATLSHDGVTTAYYGADALKNAHSAATHGDVITLSSGQFNAVEITKAITLRGTGMVFDSEKQKKRTTITGSVTIKIPDVPETLTLEGLFFVDGITIGSGTTLKNAKFIKSRFRSFYNSATVTNPVFFHCKIAEGGGLPNSTFINCVVWFCQSNVEYHNCIIHSNQSSGAFISDKNSTFENCILVAQTDYHFQSMDSSNAVYNCIGIYPTRPTSSSYRMFAGITNNTNRDLEGDGSNLFKTFRTQASYTDSETFELTDEAASAYLGTDGTQVGIYGGDLPFDSTPSNPQITQFDVEKNVANGKLTVKINVE